MSEICTFITKVEVRRAAMCELHYMVMKEPQYAYKLAMDWDVKAEDVPTILSKSIRAERFVNRHGHRVSVGWATEAQEALGVPFEAFQNLYEVNQQLRRENIKLQDMNDELYQRLGEGEKQSFWTKLKDSLKFMCLETKYSLGESK